MGSARAIGLLWLPQAGGPPRAIETATHSDKKHWTAAAAKLRKRLLTRHFTDRDYVYSVEGGRFLTIKPANGEVLAEVAVGTAHSPTSSAPLPERATSDTPRGDGAACSVSRAVPEGRPIEHIRRPPQERQKPTACRGTGRALGRCNPADPVAPPCVRRPSAIQRRSQRPTGRAPRAPSRATR